MVKKMDMDDVPPFFRCPISLDLIEDPVTLSTGQTYDRFCIEKWLGDGNSTCPVTMQKLHDFSMVPNYALRRLIDDWVRRNAVSESGTLCLDEVERILGSDSSAFEDKIQVLEKVRLFSSELPLKNSVLVHMGVFKLLLGLVLGDLNGVCSSERMVLLEKALDCAVILLPFTDISELNTMNHESVFKTLLFLFVHGSVSIKRSLCYFVQAIACSSETREIYKKLSNSRLFIQQIVALIDEESAGIIAVSALSTSEQNQEVLVHENVVEKLLDYLSRNRTELAPVAMETLENLLTIPGVKAAIVNHKSGIRSIVDMVFRVSDHEGSESAVNSLLVICSDSKVSRQKAVVNGILTQLLLLLQSQCSVGAKLKAKMLLKLLPIRSFQIYDP